MFLQPQLNTSTQFCMTTEISLGCGRSTQIKASFRCREALSTQKHHLDVEEVHRSKPHSNAERNDTEASFGCGRSTQIKASFRCREALSTQKHHLDVEEVHRSKPHSDTERPEYTEASLGCGKEYIIYVLLSASE